VGGLRPRRSPGSGARGLERGPGGLEGGEIGEACSGRGQDDGLGRLKPCDSGGEGRQDVGRDDDGAVAVGAAAVEAGFFAPLRAAFTGLHRRDEIFIGGANRRHERGFWCAAVTHDGVLPVPGGGEESLDLVERMFSTLGAFDPATSASEGQTGPGGTWAEAMMWNGPAGIGSNDRWEGFVTDHRASFLSAFPDRQGGNRYARISDGAYAAVSGWPSMTMTFQGDYLGVKADGRALTLRVMDFYRCAGGRIAENWVFLDCVDLFRQMGVDLLAGPVAPVSSRG
jgi:predicted ester cyclase